MLKNLKIMGLCIMLLAITPTPSLHARTHVWNTGWKTILGIAFGIPSGLLRWSAHVLTRETARSIWGGPDSYILQKPLAIAVGTVMWLGLNSFIEIGRTNAVEKFEQNLDDERNTGLADFIARNLDWIVGLMGIIDYEGYPLMSLLHQKLIPSDDTVGPNTVIQVDASTIT